MEAVEVDSSMRRRLNTIGIAKALKVKPAELFAGV